MAETYREGDVQQWAAEAAANWIIDQVYRANYYAADDALAYLQRHYGAALVTVDAAGTLVLRPAVRDALRTLGQGHIVWEGELRRWRRRERYDAAWRRAA